MLIYIDGNHIFDSTIRYFNLLGKASGYRCIMVLDDINWSGEMARAWKIIRGFRTPGCRAAPLSGGNPIPGSWRLATKILATVLAIHE